MARPFIRAAGGDYTRPVWVCLTLQLLLQVCDRLEGRKGNTEQVARPAPSGIQTMGLQGKSLFLPAQWPSPKETTSLSLLEWQQPASQLWRFMEIYDLFIALNARRHFKEIYAFSKGRGAARCSTVWYELILSSGGFVDYLTNPG